uniref:Uncharacterized protein n=1 Tax=Rhizophora mucronata TaxID=61149 RepID=A0A2P2KEL3_RHIMU
MHGHSFPFELSHFLWLGDPLFTNLYQMLVKMLNGLFKTNECLNERYGDSRMQVIAFPSKVIMGSCVNAELQISSFSIYFWFTIFIKYDLLSILHAFLNINCDKISLPFKFDVLALLANLLCHLLEHPWTNLLVIDFISAVTAPFAWGWLYNIFLPPNLRICKRAFFMKNNKCRF